MTGRRLRAEVEVQNALAIPIVVSRTDLIAVTIDVIATASI
jgi:hypothetical protein